MDKTHDSNLKSWVNVDEKSDFPIQNIPFGVYSPKEGGDLHVATAIGNYVLDLAYLDEAGLFKGTEIEGPEVPIMDGSSKQFIALIEEAGIKKLTEKRQYLRILKNVEVIDGDKRCSLKPSSKMEFFASIDFSDRVIGKQESYISMDQFNFKKHK